MDRNVSIEDYEQLIKDGDSIVVTSDSFNTEIDKIYATIDELKETWTGSSAQKYTDDIESFRQDLYDFQKLVKGHGALVNSVGKDYKHLEEEL